MYWQLTTWSRHEAETPAPDAQRFVLHRHRDASGAHHDLRLEDGNCLLGFRIAGDALEAGCWATEKMPHPTDWLEQDRDAERISAGAYQWRALNDQRRELTLYGKDETVTARFERCDAPAIENVRALATLAREHKIAMNDLATLVEDGLAARRNAIARFCGLSRELDGSLFDEDGWRQLLAGMTLKQVGERLAAVEARYDRAHPPEPVSRPEPLAVEQGAQQERAQRAIRILGM